MKDSKVGEVVQALSDKLGANAISPALYTSIFDAFEEAVVVADTNRNIVYVNTASERLFGYPKGALLGKKTKILYADESDFSEQGQKRFNANSSIAAQNYREVYRRHDGAQFLGVTTGAVMRSNEGKTVGYIGIIRPARSAEQSLDTVQKIHNVTSDILLSHDEKIHSLLQIALNHFGLNIAILACIEGNNYVVKDCVDLCGELKPSMQFATAGTYCTHTLAQNKAVGFHYVAQSEIRDHPCYKNFKLESYIGVPVQLDKELFGTLNFSSASPVEPFVKDDYILMEMLADTVSYLLYKKQSEEAIEYLAKVDDLTSLLNRRATLERLGDVIAQSNRFAYDISVLAIDLDHFKSINDKWGHAAGDHALIEFARVVSGLGRKTDFCGRIGGEEFVFVLPGTSLESSENIGNNLRHKLAVEPVELSNGVRITLSVSIGVATLKNNESLESLLARADEALYAAKQKGRNCVSLAL